ncbi:MAG: hypothetical protein U0002_12735 [Thermoanaerobaculia bacterium]
MELIVTRARADLDGFAAGVAALRLFPQARFFPPDYRSPAVRRAIEAELLPRGALEPTSLDPGRLSRMILCGCRRADQLGIPASWLIPGHAVELVAFDHHPSSPRDLPFLTGRLDPAVGATSTLVCEALREAGIRLEPGEATLLLAGIHAGTRGLVASATSARDLEAAAWLLTQRAELSALRETLFSGGDALGFRLAEEMIHALAIEELEGWRLGTVSLAEEGPSGPRDPLLGRIAELFRLDVLLVLVTQDDGLRYLAYSRVAQLGLARALAELGAVGDGNAVSALLAGVDEGEVRSSLLAALLSHLPGKGQVAAACAEPPFALEESVSVAEARKRLQLRQQPAALVVGSQGASGQLSLSTLDAALDHQLGEQPVSRVMSGELEWVSPNASLAELERRLSRPGTPFLLVQGNEPARPPSWITPQRLLARLAGEADAQPFSPADAERPLLPGGDLRPALERLVSPELLARLWSIRQIAARCRVPIYLVGGPVRDLLLGRSVRDLDLLVDGRVSLLAAQLAVELEAELVEHPEFLTATLKLGTRARIDLASARCESYEAPAALPKVRAASLAEDLRRRDFTLNALAIRLYPGEGLELIDLVGGQKDLASRQLRTFHSLSFFDDPTRILRGLRFELTLGLRLSPEASRQVESALAAGVFARLSADRLRHELVKLLSEPGLGLAAVDRLAELGLLSVLHPDLQYRASQRQRLREVWAGFEQFRRERLDRRPLSAWRLLVAALAAPLPAHQREAIADRLGLAGDDRQAVVGEEAARNAARQVCSAPRSRPFEVAESLDALGEEELVLLFAEGGTERGWVDLYVRQLRRIELDLKGADLVRWGLAPGPEVGRVLRAVRRARLDGLIPSGEELSFALRVAGLS